MPNSLIVHIKQLHEPDPKEIREFIRIGFLSICEAHFLPIIDDRKIKFKYNEKASLAKETCLTMYISHKKRQGCESKLTCTLMPQGVSRRKTAQACVIATCVVDKPR
jgi:hypothetical protein